MNGRASARIATDLHAVSLRDPGLYRGGGVTDELTRLPIRRFCDFTALALRQSDAFRPLIDQAVRPECYPRSARYYNGVICAYSVKSSVIKPAESGSADVDTVPLHH